MSESKIHTYVNLIQVLMGLCVFFLFCLAFFFLGGASSGSMWSIVKMTAKAAVLPVGVYVVNYCFLVPLLFFNGRKLWFFLADALVIFAALFLPVLFMGSPDDVDVETLTQQINGFSVLKLLIGAILMRIVLYMSMIALAVGMRYVLRWYEEKKKLEEERRRNTEAELNWLKNQLNPHFLFNTLNNISSLVRLDADKAQDSIAQLSDLLRYALYESNNAKVKVEDEIAFMRNYIDLMSLRCNDKTRVEVWFGSFDPGLRLSPLLFISLIENAFKHGVSAHVESFVTVDMGMEGRDIVFTCMNSVIERETADYSGSGIGLENMKRRLELLYHDNYSYEQHQKDGKYTVQVRIRNIADYV